MNNKDSVKCFLSNTEVMGRITRLKQHIAHVNVRPCPKQTAEAKRICLEAIELSRARRQKRNEEVTSLRNEVVVGSTESGSGSGLGSGLVLGTEQSKEAPLQYGVLGRFVEINPVDPTKFMCQQKVSTLLDKKRVHDMQMYIALWIYESRISFNAINRSSFIKMLEAVGQFGPGAPPPFQYQLREPYLMEAVDIVKHKLKKHKEEWFRSGCSIMTDGWSDRRRRSVMNICVRCKQGVSFFGSKEASSDAHT